MFLQAPFAPLDLAAKAAEAAALMKALSNKQRLLILCHLIDSGEMPAGHLVERIGLSQSALSQHLSKLREENLVDFRREAQTLFYRVVDPRAGQVLAVLRSIYCPDLKPSSSGNFPISPMSPPPDDQHRGE